MKNAALEIMMIWIALAAANSAPKTAAARFRKLSPHFFCLESGVELPNTGAIVTEEGVLLIDPPPEAQSATMLSALRAVTSRPVRWVVITDFQKTGGAAVIAKQGAAWIDSRELDRLAIAAAASDPNPAAPSVPASRFVFGSQLHLFPAGVEIRLMAVKGRARTAGDLVVFLPSEKILAVGDLYTPGSYPAIDIGPGEGTALGWIDGLKEVIESVPLLKSAMPQPKPDPAAALEPEKTLEESVIVVPGRGKPSDLQQMKDLLASAQRLRLDAARAVATGRSSESFVNSLAVTSFGAYINYEAFASLLYEELSNKKHGPCAAAPASRYRSARSQSSSL